MVSTRQCNRGRAAARRLPAPLLALGVLVVAGCQTDGALHDASQVADEPSVTLHALAAPTESAGSVLVLWSTGDGSPAVVTVVSPDGSTATVGDGPEGCELVASADESSSRVARLSDPMSPGRVIKETPVRSADGRPGVWAAPNPTRGGLDRFSTAFIGWTTGGEVEGQVYVRVGEGEEQLFAAGSVGCGTASWIGRGSPYDFRLYAGDNQTRALDRVTVTQRESARRAPSLWIDSSGDRMVLRWDTDTDIWGRGLPDCR